MTTKTDFKQKRPELLPCPFCGEVAELHLGRLEFHGAEVECTYCGASGGHHSTDRWGKYAIEHWNSRASLQSPDREKEIDTGEVAEQLRDMAASAYETAMHFGITQDSFEHLAHRVFDLACRVEGKA